jgi:hypothetical protein
MEVAGEQIFLIHWVASLWQKALTDLAFLRYWLHEDNVFDVTLLYVRQGNLAALKLILTISYFPT